MTEGGLMRFLRENWYLAALIVLLLAGAAVLYTRPESQPVGNAPRPVSPDGPQAAPSPLEPQPPRPDDQEVARSQIEKLQETYDADPKSADAPAALNGMANLNRQKLLNYGEAIRLYELLLLDFPDWEGISRVYPNLATCYERNGDNDGARSVYKRMMEKFPPESQEYLYAKTQLEM